MDIGNIHISVFAKTEKDVKAATAGLEEFLTPEVASKEGIIESSKTDGFSEEITILKTVLNKKRDIRKVMEFLMDNLGEKEKKILSSQASSRLDEENTFFFRLDRESWINSKEMKLVAKGDCFHWKLSIITYPRKREAAIKAIQELMQP